MADDPSRNWARASEWPKRHGVQRAFVRLARSTLDRKRAGFGRLALLLSHGERAVLVASRARLLDVELGARAVGGMADLLAGIEQGLGDDAATNWERPTWLALMGLAPDSAWPPPSGREGRDYVVAQFRAVEARPWIHPSQAIIFAAAQAAVHLTLSTTQRQDESEVTIDLTKEFTGNVKRSFIDAMEGERAHLPDGAFLDVATASMTNGRDRLGADFAVVTGFIDQGVTRYRVALLQAKWEDKDARNRAEVWHGGGMQLDELVATGMGYYVFYPRVYRLPGHERPVFLATVRSAEAVQADARTLSHAKERPVTARIRISTSPPNEYEPVEGDASYYCEIAEIQDWASFAVVAAQADALKAILKTRALAAYLVYGSPIYGSSDKELGVVICHEDDEEGLMYCGVDRCGRAKSEPAVNEALWHVANAAAALPNDHRLKRDAEGPSSR